MSYPKVEPPSDAEQAAVILSGAIGQIEFARAYVLELLEATPREAWFRVPEGSFSSIAWQVGHLAVSQYGLLMFRQRGRRPEDLDLIPGKFRKRYGRGGEPLPDAEGQPTADELMQRLDEVYRLALAEIRNADPQRLLEPVEMPYACYPIKLGAILFCPMHEQLHAGQIGMQRRLLGLDSIR